MAVCLDEVRRTRRGGDRRGRRRPSVPGRLRRHHDCPRPEPRNPTSERTADRVARGHEGAAGAGCGQPSCGCLAQRACRPHDGEESPDERGALGARGGRSTRDTDRVSAERNRQRTGCAADVRQRAGGQRGLPRQPSASRDSPGMVDTGDRPAGHRPLPVRHRPGLRGDCRRSAFRYLQLSTSGRHPPVETSQAPHQPRQRRRGGVRTRRARGSTGGDPGRRRRSRPGHCRSASSQLSRRMCSGGLASFALARSVDRRVVADPRGKACSVGRATSRRTTSTARSYGWAGCTGSPHLLTSCCSGWHANSSPTTGHRAGGDTPGARGPRRSLASGAGDRCA